jgi:integrase
LGQGKQAKILTEAQIAKVLNNLGKRSRYAVRDRAMFLLSIKAGLRAKEIANLKWSMVTDAEGSLLDVMALPNKASKGAGGGRSIPMNRDLRTALVELAAAIDDRQGDDPVIASERGGPMNAGAVTMWFWRVYRSLGFKGTSSHSGRRTFITRAAKRSQKLADRCETSSSSPAMRAYQPRSATSKGIPKPSASWWTSSDAAVELAPRRSAANKLVLD